MRDPNVPESLEGWWILHRMFSFKRRAWDALTPKKREKFAAHATDLFVHLQHGDDGDAGLAQVVGHKADLMVTHYARTYDGLTYAQTLMDKLELRDFLEPRGSYVSVLEIGLYDATAKIHADLESRGLKVNGAEWIMEFDRLLREQAESPHVAPRLWAKIPQRRYVCFYPMNKRRGETENWYSLPYADRARLMVEHGKVGRTYHGQVTQVISGSIGYDDYEWGVDLYADDPLVFKKLIYDMRFDEVSAKYAEFGPFYSGVQFSPDQLHVFLNGDGVPSL
jgi:hydrogen peroxide-dependent heme synthase